MSQLDEIEVHKARTLRHELRCAQLEKEMKIVNYYIQVMEDGVDTRELLDHYL